MNLRVAEQELRTVMSARPQRTLCVDLDGTLASYDHWRGLAHIGKPIKSVVSMVRREAARGSYIIINTCRVTTAVTNRLIPQSLEAVCTWLKKNRIPYDEVWAATGKPYGAVYLDDKAANPACSMCMKRINDKKEVRKSRRVS